MIHEVLLLKALVLCYIVVFILLATTFKSCVTYVTSRLLQFYIHYILASILILKNLFIEFGVHRVYHEHIIFTYF